MVRDQDAVAGRGSVAIAAAMHLIGAVDKALVLVCCFAMVLDGTARK